MENKTQKDTQPDEKNANPSPESADTTPINQADTSNTPKQNPFKRFGTWYWRKKKWTLPLSLLLLLIIALAVPFTRYPMISWFWKQDVNFTVKDNRSGAPVSGVSLSVAGKTSQTDKEGVAKLTDIPVGPQKVEASKKYYKTQTSGVLVSEFGGNKQTVDIDLEATGRLVQVSVTNAISGTAIEDATVTTEGDNHTTTNKEGKATIVVDAAKSEVEATISAQGFNKRSVNLTVTDDAAKNAFTLVASGKIYFLSKQSGKVDVVKTNLDGSERKVVFAGTGSEEEHSTSLLAARDWKYLAFHSKRDAAKKPALYLINTADDTVVPIDEGNATFTPVGWFDHRFIYKITRENQVWQPKHEALKSFNAETKQITTLDETLAEGNNQFDSRYEILGEPYITNSGVVYTKAWSKMYEAFNINFNGKQSAIFSIKPDGTGKQTLKAFDPNDIQFITARLYAPGEVYFSLSYRDTNKPAGYLELENGVIKDAPTGQAAFERNYPTYLVSPNGKATFWADPRDGKNTLLIGDINGKSEKQIATSSDFTAYGWFSDRYVLVSKNRSELFIMSKDGLKEGQQPLKISDYHKPFANFSGYGYGYGGI